MFNQPWTTVPILAYLWIA